MSFQSVEFPIAGPSYQSRSKPLSSQRTVNWYQQVSEEGKDNFVLMPFPGLLPIGSYSTVSSDRGLTRMREILYQVKGTSLFKITSDGTHTNLGTIGGSGRCTFANDGINLVVVTGGKTYIYSTDTGSIVESTTVGTTGALSVAVINSLYLFTFADTTVTAFLDNSTKLFDTQGSVSAESNPDDLLRDFIFEQTIYRMGKRTIESWYNTPELTPPIARIEGQTFEVGLAAIHSVAKTDEALYWLGDDNAVYRARAGTKERVSTDAISNELSKLDVSNAYAHTFTLEGQNFYLLQIAGRPAFVLNESLGKKGWFELSSGIEDLQWQGSSVIDCYGKLWVADESNGKVYNLDLDTFTNDGDTLKRTRVTTSINGGLFGRKGQRIQMSRMQIIMETGTGLITGQGENPRIMIEASYDGGRTWAAGDWARVGRLGEHTLKVEWHSLKSFYDMMVRLTTTDPVNYTVYTSTIDVRVAGK
jgi:hypothetical protein